VLLEKYAEVAGEYQKCILTRLVVHVTACLRQLQRFGSDERYPFSLITSPNWNEILYRYQNGDEKITKYVYIIPDLHITGMG
jgi:hypothetical protein